MRYLVIDLEGNQRGSFDSVDDLIEELNEGAQDDAEAVHGMHVVAYRDGSAVGPPTSADELLAAHARLAAAERNSFVFDFIERSVRAGHSRPPARQVEPAASVR